MAAEVGFIEPMLLLRTDALPDDPEHWTFVFRVVQPWGRDVATESAILSEHPSASEAFAEIDRLSDQMVRRCAERCGGTRRD